MAAHIYVGCVVIVFNVKCRYTILFIRRRSYLTKFVLLFLLDNKEAFNCWHVVPQFYDSTSEESSK